MLRSFKEAKITIDLGHKYANKYKRNYNLIDVMNKVQNVLSVQGDGWWSERCSSFIPNYTVIDKSKILT